MSITSAVSGSPDPGKDIFNTRNFLIVVGAIVAASWGLFVWNAQAVIADIHTAVSTAQDAKYLSVANKEAIDRMSRTESQLANIATAGDTRLSIVEDRLHIQRSPSIRLYDTGR